MTPQQKWRTENTEKARAHWMVHEAIEKGLLERRPCEKCGNPKVHAHHDDYAKPLEVTWLCSRHHRQLHAERQGQSIHAPYVKPTPTRPDHKKYQPAPLRERLIEQAAVYRADGMSYRQVAERLGVTKGTVYKWLNSPTYG